MKFVRIDPNERTASIVEADSVETAAPELHARGVDHGIVMLDGVRLKFGIITYEFGLVDLEAPYFALGGQLFSGEALLYDYDESGVTVDVPTEASDIVRPEWLPTADDVERAISAGVVVRPEVAWTQVDRATGISHRRILWRWPHTGYRP